MDALAAYGSDSSSSSEDGAPAPAPAVSSERKASARSNHDQKSESPQDRKRRWDQAAGNQSENRNGQQSSMLLPKPPVLAGNQTSLILWEADFLSKKQVGKQELSELPEGIVASSTALIEAVKQEFDSKSPTTTAADRPKSWASLLKAQHEFHNPRFLDNVASQCGIESILGSNISEPETFEEYEYKILELEERARMQTFDQNVQLQQTMRPSQFAQSQLEQALQKECHR